jgi:uncharacterized protein (TIGR00725 family)
MKTIVGVMGPGDQTTQAEAKTAYDLGKAIAQEGWVLLTGGRNRGVMEAASRGAKAANGLTIGILPADHTADMSSFVDIPIVTGLGNGRNIINVLSSHILVACGKGAGTASEVALALKVGKPIAFIETDATALKFWRSLTSNPLHISQTVDQVIFFARDVLTQTLS